MFCEKCGKQLADGSAFCDNCGAAQTPAAAQPQAEPVYAAPQATPVYAAPVAAPKKKFDFSKLTKKQKMIGGGIIGGVLALIVILIIILCQPKSIKLDKYMSATVTGYNNYATITYEFDSETLVTDVLGKKAVEQIKNAQYGSWSDLANAGGKIAKLWADSMALSSAYHVDVTYPEGKTNGKLSNGDEIIYTLTFDEGVAKKYDIKAKTREFKYKVEGLPEASVYNLLDNFSIEFTGVDGYGRAQLKSSAVENKAGDVSFRVSENDYYVYYEEYSNANDYTDSGSFYVYISGDTYNLSNGDVLTITVDTSSTRLQEYGVILDGLTKEVTVEGLTEPEEFDVLSNFTVNFTGVDGDGDADVVAVEAKTVTVGNMTFTFKEGDNYVYYEYVDGTGYNSSFGIWVDNSYNLSNGDTVNMYTNYDADSFTDDGGVVLTNLSVDVTVEGLGEYMTTTEDADFTAISEAYEEKIYNKLYEDWEWVVHGSYYGDYKNQKISDDFKLYKAVLTVPKNTSSYDKNTLWLVYSVTLDDSELEKATKYYLFVDIDNVVVNADGEVEPKSGDYDYSYYIYKGYTSYTDLYEDYIENFNLTIEEADLAA